MHLDFELINDATNNASNSLKDRISTESNSLFRLNNFFGKLFINKLEAFCKSNSNWIFQTDADNLPLENRNKISWIPNSVVEETHIIFENLTPIIQQIFSRDLKFDGISIWQDKTNYFIGKHQDNPRIEAAIQIYLSESAYHLGTVFECKNDNVEIEYKKNSGYLMDNEEKLIHYMLNPVPVDHVRYSVYAIWVKS